MSGGPTRSIRLPPWRVDVTIEPGVPRLLPMTVLARAIARALEAAGAPSPASVGLILADDALLSELNEEHMGKSGPTDVLSFPLLPPDAFPGHPGKAPDRTRPAPFILPPGRTVHLGDVIVSVERAIDQAEAGRGGQGGDIRWPSADELRLLVTHGTLHLCGWDHAEPKEAAAMRFVEHELIGGP